MNHTKNRMTNWLIEEFILISLVKFKTRFRQVDNAVWWNCQDTIKPMLY